MGSGMAAVAAPVPAAQPASQALKSQDFGALAQSYDGSDAGFSTSKLFAIEVDELATDPELEEAAIRFANGDDAGAENGLLEALRGGAIDPQAGLSWAAALLDMYRATRSLEKFDAAVREFGFLFDRTVPVWVDIVGTPIRDAVTVPAPATAGTATRTSGALWDSPEDLSAAAMEELREAMSSAPPPWHLDWSQLGCIEADAMPLLGGLFASLCAEDVSLRFSGGERLVQTLRAMMPSGDRSVDTDWWSVRLNALRAMHMQDEFELAALDFCVTFEVSPPAWDPGRCSYEAISLAERPAEAVAVSGWGSGHGSLPTAPMGLDTMAATQLELKGLVLGDATQALAGLDRESTPGERIIVSCAGLVRVDFSAAGSILNWVATRQSEGCKVQFRDVHRLVAAFFNVIGINEHSRVVPRPI
jgi:hypothetical protein